MFDGVPDQQFHQFIASTPPLPIPLSFPPLIHASSPPFPTFDPYTVPHLLHQLHHQSPAKEETNLERSLSQQIDPWSNHEVLALLRIRSSMENWFPDLIWEHVSRKLAEVGFKRSAENCKQKFEEETRNFNSISFNKNHRFFSELEQVCHGDNTTHGDTENNQSNIDEEAKMGQSFEKDPRNVTVAAQEFNEQAVVMKKSSKKRKRERRNLKFEMFKGFCVQVVSKMMAQQEELHIKLLEDMVTRDEEKIARQEAWKKQEMERVNKEIEIRAREQAIAGDRQATIIDFLNKFTSNYSSQNQLPNSLTHPPLVPQNHTSTSHHLITTQTKYKAVSSLTVTQHQPSNPSSCTSDLPPPKLPTSSAPALASASPTPPNSPHSLNNPFPPTPSLPHKTSQNDIGRRWPRDEVLALINMRSSLNGSNDQDKEGGAKCSLWERISQGMLELGYKRSAKRCKEKWENINKYFRKTKDVNKKRSVDSRTCPYFQQLSTLYNQGTLVGTQNVPENSSAIPENSSIESGFSDAKMHVDDDGKNDNPVPAFNFEF